MNLSDYMSLNGTSDAKFAEIVGVDRSSISRMRRGLHLPNREVMSRIVEATNGAVTPNDFFGIDLPSEGEAA